MTETTQAERDAKVEAYLQLLKDNLPEILRGEDIVRICGTIITSYGDVEEALEWTHLLIGSLAKYYVGDKDTDDECGCPKCTERRRAVAH